MRTYQENDQENPTDLTQARYHVYRRVTHLEMARMLRIKGDNDLISSVFVRHGGK